VVPVSESIEAGMTAVGHNRKSVLTMRISAFEGRADIDFGRLEVSL